MSDLSYIHDRSRVDLRPGVLTERLEQFDELGDEWAHRNVPEFMFDFVAAARRWDALTSAENVEKGALAIVNMPYDSLELRNGDKSELFAEAKIAESVLRAVSEETP